MPIVSIPAEARQIAVPTGTRLLEALTQADLHPDTPCAGRGTCGKCKVLVDGTEVLACQTIVEQDMTVALPQKGALRILQAGTCDAVTMNPLREGPLLAFDIGTTTVVCFLLDGTTGNPLAVSSMPNPQAAFGADVISRIQAALGDALPQLTGMIRDAMATLIRTVCEDANISSHQIGVVSVVGNPAMQQFLLGLSPTNLANIPFSPVLTEAKAIPCQDILPICPQAQMLILPDIAGFVGADTMGCLLATKLYEQDALTLLVDIGTNGEMVLGNKNRMIACATAAGPALEGANIHFGMGAADGAIDHVWLEKGKIQCSVIGGDNATGICGSGLIDAIAVGLELGLLNARGRIQNTNHIFQLTEDIYLTQDDIRQVQLAKGAICAGITLMAKQLGLQIQDIQKVQLAGAFGSYMNPKNACRIGLLPEELMGRIEALGNAAGCGAKMLACDQAFLPLTQTLTGKIEFLELATVPGFPKVFAKAMLFREEIV